MASEATHPLIKVNKVFSFMDFRQGLELIPFPGKTLAPHAVIRQRLLDRGMGDGWRSSRGGIGSVGYKQIHLSLAFRVRARIAGPLSVAQNTHLPRRGARVPALDLRSNSRS